MPDVASLVEPFFSRKQRPGRKFAESSRIKYLPLLKHLASWAGERNVEELTTAVMEAEYLPLWRQA